MVRAISVRPDGRELVVLGLELVERLLGDAVDFGGHGLLV